MNIVLYRSKYGHTLQYATWIANALNAELRAFDAFKKKEIANYDTIVFGTGVYVGAMNGIKKALKMFANKSIVIFACGGNAGVEADIKQIKDHNFTAEQLAYHSFFYLPGGLDLSKVKGIMKFFMNMGKKALQAKQDKTKDDIEFLKGFEQPTYYVDEANIASLVDFVRSRTTSK
jgi:menaquinone-dependent protoporphyrinogen IX oxidase